MIKEMAQVIDAKIIYDPSNGALDILSCCGADLMSDVMAFVKENVMLLTGLVNPQVIRTAEMMEIKAITFVRGKEPTQAVIDLAQEMGIAVLSTQHPMYTTCGLLYTAGIGR